MYIEVGPARRRGNTNAIYDEPLRDIDMEVEPDGGITLTVNATGVNCLKSHYRYRIRFTQRDAQKLVRAVSNNRLP